MHLCGIIFSQTPECKNFHGKLTHAKMGVVRREAAL